MYKFNIIIISKSENESVFKNKNAILKRMDKTETKENLRALLKAKIGEKKIGRSSAITKERVLNTTMKQMGIDKDKFMEYLKLAQQQQPK